MKSLWNLVSTLAVINLLAMLLFVGWLWQSGRLNGQRVQAARQLFGTPIEALGDVAGSESPGDAATAASPTGITAASWAESIGPGLSSDAQIEFASRMDERARLASRRVAEEQRQLMAQLGARLAELDAAEATFATEKAAWEAAVRDEQARRVDEQFLKAVKQLESVPPKQAKGMLEELVASGAMRQAVSYLDAMDARAARKVMSEFKEPAEIALATQLLEMLRTFGTPAEGQEPPRDAQRAAAASEPTPPDA
jgi:hypothetical protein